MKKNTIRKATAEEQLAALRERYEELKKSVGTPKDFGEQLGDNAGKLIDEGAALIRDIAKQLDDRLLERCFDVRDVTDNALREIELEPMREACKAFAEMARDFALIADCVGDTARFPELKTMKDITFVPSFGQFGTDFAKFARAINAEYADWEGGPYLRSDDPAWLGDPDYVTLTNGLGRLMNIATVLYMMGKAADFSLRAKDDTLDVALEYELDELKDGKEVAE